jgi:hypothetical protein
MTHVLDDPGCSVACVGTTTRELGETPGATELDVKPPTKVLRVEPGATEPRVTLSMLPEVVGMLPR